MRRWLLPAMTVVAGLAMFRRFGIDLVTWIEDRASQPAAQDFGWPHEKFSAGAS